MVAIVAEPFFEDFVSEQLAEQLAEQVAEIVPFPRAPGRALGKERVSFVGADDPRAASRKEVALKCWLVDEEESARGYALDISKDGARVSGVGAGFAEGQRLLVKLMLDDKEPALVMRCKIMHVGQGEVGVRFLELGFNEWFRLGRFLDRL